MTRVFRHVKQVMDRDFEIFQAGPNEARSLRLNVTISRQRIIRINRNVYEKLARPEAVRLSYSHQRNAIGIESVSPRFNEAFPLIPERSGHRINAAPFCRHFNIAPDTTRKFITPELEGRTMMLKLRETISVARTKQKRPKKA